MKFCKIKNTFPQKPKDNGCKIYIAINSVFSQQATTIKANINDKIGVVFRTK